MATIEKKYQTAVQRGSLKARGYGQGIALFTSEHRSTR